MSNKPIIPSWQRAQTGTQPTTSQPEPQPEQQPESPPAPGAEESAKEEPQSEDVSLAEQASRFLEDPTIRDAPREEKVAFLQSKGVEAEHIERLLEAPPDDDSAVGWSEEGERAWSKTPTHAPAPRPPPRDVAPIVTYPEFLTQSTKPPPLITTRRLLNTAYVTGGLLATMYGLSKYLIAPMTEDLAESRHDFSSYTKEKLDDLNTRLGDAVSTDPATKPRSKTSEVVDDVSEADSDPTELFHRDFGTQTTPTLSRRPSVSSEADVNSVVTSHETRLKILTSHLKELEATRANDTASSDSLRAELSELTTYLGEMSYQNQNYSEMGGLYGGTYRFPKTKDGKDDHIEALKSDIRAVKGVLLSARNFPGGGPRAVGRVGG